MKKPLLSLFVIFGFTLAPALAMATTLDIPTRFQYLPDSKPLTTDQAIEIDPDQINPHRARWILKKQAQLDGLKSVRTKSGKFTVSVDSITASARSFVRELGPFYRPLEEFPCTKDPLHSFATPQGTRLAAETGAKAWDAALSVGKIKLELKLRAIKESTEIVALTIAQNLFNNWLYEVTENWRLYSLPKVHAIEWAHYNSLTKESCAQKTSKNPKPGQPWHYWDTMMEPPAAPGNAKLIARVPSRRWNGMFSIRLAIKAADKTLNGQFLIDTTARSSVISPDFLIRQGVLPIEVDMSGAPLEKLRWGLAARAQGEGALAKRVRVDNVELGGHAIELRDFLLHETEFFGEPESVSACCDGVLGNDFLRRYVLEIKPGTPAEVSVYRPAGYRPEGVDQYQWFEAASTLYGEMASPCTIKQGKQALLGAVWNTAEEKSLTRHKSSDAPGVPSTILCGTPPDVIADGLNSSRSKYEYSRRSTLAADIGISTIARGPFILDFGHGRIWLSKLGVARSVPENRSGLSILYIFQKGDRVLKVTGIKPGSPAGRLAKSSGLAVGDFLQDVDGKAIEEVDEWEVLQRLSGAYGNSVALKWTKGRKLVGATLELTP